MKNKRKNGFVSESHKTADVIPFPKGRLSRSSESSPQPSDTPNKSAKPQKMWLGLAAVFALSMATNGYFNSIVEIFGGDQGSMQMASRGLASISSAHSNSVSYDEILRDSSLDLKLARKLASDENTGSYERHDISHTERLRFEFLKGKYQVITRQKNGHEIVEAIRLPDGSQDEPQYIVDRKSFFAQYGLALFSDYKSFEKLSTTRDSARTVEIYVLKGQRDSSASVRLELDQYQRLVSYLVLDI